MPYQNSSRNFLLIWKYSSHYKSIASCDKTKIPLNLRRKTVAQILSRGDEYSPILYASFFFNLSPGIGKVYSCAWRWRFEWYDSSCPTSLFLWNWNSSCDWDRAISSLDFEKYAAKGVIGDLSCRSALHRCWCKLYFHFRYPGDSEQNNPITLSRGRCRRPWLLQGSLCSWGKDWLRRSFLYQLMWEKKSTTSIRSN